MHTIWLQQSFDLFIGFNTAFKNFGILAQPKLRNAQAPETEKGFAFGFRVVEPSYRPT